MTTKDSGTSTTLDHRRVIRAAEAAALLSVSTWTVRRLLKSKAVKIGSRVTGYRLSDVLALPESATP